NKACGCCHASSGKQRGTLANAANELIRVKANVSSQTAKDSSAAGGYRPSNIKDVVATPLTPRKLKYIGYRLPSTATKTNQDFCCVVKSNLWAKCTGSTPLLS